MIDNKILNIDKILELDSNEKHIPLIEKVIKLAEELGDLQTAKLYFTAKEYMEETYDAFNISVATYNTVKGSKLTPEQVSLLKSQIDKVDSENKLESAIPIFYGKICASLLYSMNSDIKSRNIKDKDLEAYLFELIILLASQLKYIYRENIDFNSIVMEKLNKWEEKQSEYI